LPVRLHLPLTTTPPPLQRLACSQAGIDASHWHTSAAERRACPTTTGHRIERSRSPRAAAAAARTTRLFFFFFFCCHPPHPDEEEKEEEEGGYLPSECRSRRRRPRRPLSVRSLPVCPSVRPAPTSRHRPVAALFVVGHTCSFAFFFFALPSRVPHTHTRTLSRARTRFDIGEPNPRVVVARLPADPLDMPAA
jgi:hypothetical protein